MNEAQTTPVFAGVEKSQAKIKQLTAALDSLMDQLAVKGQWLNVLEGIATLATNNATNYSLMSSVGILVTSFQTCPELIEAFQIGELQEKDKEPHAMYQALHDHTRRDRIRHQLYHKAVQLKDNQSLPILAATVRFEIDPLHDKLFTENLHLRCTLADVNGFQRSLTLNCRNFHSRRLCTNELTNWEVDWIDGETFDVRAFQFDLRRVKDYFNEASIVSVFCGSEIHPDNVQPWQQDMVDAHQRLLALGKNDAFREYFTTAAGLFKDFKIPEPRAELAMFHTAVTDVNTVPSALVQALQRMVAMIHGVTGALPKCQMADVSSRVYRVEMNNQPTTDFRTLAALCFTQDECRGAMLVEDFQSGFLIQETDEKVAGTCLFTYSGGDRYSSPYITLDVGMMNKLLRLKVSALMEHREVQ